MKIIDASVAIDALRGDTAAQRLLTELGASSTDVIGSEVTRFEILAGMLPSEEEPTERFFAEVIWLPVDEVVARTAASLARVFRARNRGIDDADYIVAATAALLGADLLTTNVKHFPMFPELSPPY